MNKQELFTQLSQDNYKVDYTEKGKTKTGTIQEIRMYGTKDVMVAILFPEAKWDQWFTTNDEIKARTYFLKDLKTHIE